MPHDERALRGLTLLPTFSGQQAVEAGLDRRRLTPLTRGGRLVRLAPNMYAAAAPDRSPTQWHAQRADALIRRFAGAVVASHITALVLHDLPVVDADLDIIHLTYRRHSSSHRRRDYVVHRSDASSRSLAPDAIMTTVADAVVSAGLLAGRRAFLASGDAAIHRQLTTLDDLTAAVQARARCHGIAAVRAALRAVDGRSESPGETLVRDDLWMLGYRTTPQFEITTARGRVYRADLRINGTRVLVEFDGMSKYDDPRAVRAEKAREEDLRADGWIVVRIMWQDLGNLMEIARRIEWAIAADRAQRGVRPA